MKQQPNIVIVDYGVGNINSIWNAITTLGYYKLRVSDSRGDIIGTDVLILPGVGAFAECAHNLKKRHLDEILHEAVLIKQKPILGICIGMQLMAASSEEGGMHDGLNWIPGTVVKLIPPAGYTVPHVGWNDITPKRRDVVFNTVSEAPDFYFDHSYHYQCDSSFVLAQCDYGLPVIAAIHRENIFGVQFHPEKSQNNGLKLFRSFFNAVGNQC
jgi:glutamine amidotransferase